MPISSCMLRVMQAWRTRPYLVENNTLAAAVARIKAYVKNNKIYVAAKAVDGGAVGDLSNTVMVYVP